MLTARSQHRRGTSDNDSLLKNQQNILQQDELPPLVFTLINIF